MWNNERTKPGRQQLSQTGSLKTLASHPGLSSSDMSKFQTVQVAKRAPVSPCVRCWTPPFYTLSVPAGGPSQGRAGLESSLGRPLTEFISLPSTSRATSRSHQLAFDQGLSVTWPLSPQKRI